MIPLYENYKDYQAPRFVHGTVASLNKCAGFYLPRKTGEAPWIEIVVDNIIGRTPRVRAQTLRWHRTILTLRSQTGFCSAANDRANADLGSRGPAAHRWQRRALFTVITAENVRSDAQRLARGLDQRAPLRVGPNIRPPKRRWRSSRPPRCIRDPDRPAAQQPQVRERRCRFQPSLAGWRISRPPEASSTSLSFSFSLASTPSSEAKSVPLYKSLRTRSVACVRAFQNGGDAPSGGGVQPQESNYAKRD